MGDDERTGYTLTIDFGLGGTSPDLVIGGCTVTQFAIESKEDGTAD